MAQIDSLKTVGYHFNKGGGHNSCQSEIEKFQNFLSQNFEIIRIPTDLMKTKRHGSISSKSSANSPCRSDAVMAQQVGAHE